jgi:hypothetical protein
MSTIVDTIQAIIHHELRQVRVAELGVVEAVFSHSVADDDDNYGCDVRLKNSGLLLRRVPVATGHIGTAAIPYVGDLVLVLFHQGDVNQPIIAGPSSASRWRKMTPRRSWPPSAISSRGKS